MRKNTQKQELMLNFNAFFCSIILFIYARYSPLSDNGQRFLDALNSYVQNEVKLTGKEMSKMAKELEAKYHPVFSSSKWIGCKGSLIFINLLYTCISYNQSSKPI